MYVKFRSSFLFPSLPTDPTAMGVASAAAKMTTRGRSATTTTSASSTSGIGTAASWSSRSACRPACSSSPR